MLRGRRGFPKKRGCHDSVFLQLSKYEEGRSTRSHPMRRPLFRHWRGASAANCEIAAFRAPHGDGGGGASGGVGDSRLVVIPSPREIAAGWVVGGAPWGVLSVQHGADRRAGGSAWVPLPGGLFREARV